MNSKLDQNNHLKMKWKKTAKDAELLLLFPRGRLIANMDISFRNLFVIQMNLPTLKGEPKSVE